MARRTRDMKLPFLLALCALGCDSATETDDGLLPVIVNDLTYAPCDVSQRVGQFTVELGDGYTAVQGRALSGVVPANMRKVEAEEGQCRLLLGRTLFCEPACGASQTCGEDGACIPYPTAQNLGTVRVMGLKADLSMTPNSARFYSNGATTLPYPGFDAGADISLVTSGADLPTFTLQGQRAWSATAPG